MAAARRRLAGLVELAQIAGVDLAGLAHPLRRLAEVRDAHREVRLAQQAPDYRGADRAGSARDEDSRAHPSR